MFDCFDWVFNLLTYVITLLNGFIFILEFVENK